ncbi:Uncharacterised protein [Vibrio cholerae]|nr:Uncharacterised protein [Vibrio cholerae]
MSDELKQLMTAQQALSDAQELNAAEAEFEYIERNQRV